MRKFTVPAQEAGIRGAWRQNNVDLRFPAVVGRLYGGKTEKTLDFQNNNGIIKAITKVSATKTATVAVSEENVPSGFLNIVVGKVCNGGVA